VSEPGERAAPEGRLQGVVTVSRRYGAGGARIAPAIAEALGFRFADSDVVDLAARQMGVDPKWALQHDERVPDILENLGRALAAASPEFGIAPEPVLDERALADAVRNVIHSLADAGGFVILGRGSQAALADRDDACNLLLVADERTRVERIRRWQDVSEKEARARIERNDRERREYVRRFYGRDVDDPILYDAVIDNGRLGLRRAARVAIGIARIKLNPAA